jgi:hypothetical protein
MPWQCIHCENHNDNSLATCSLCGAGRQYYRAAEFERHLGKIISKLDSNPRYLHLLKEGLSPEQIRDRVRELPDAVKEKILSAEIEDVLAELAEQCKLNQMQHALMEAEVLLVILGFTAPENLISRIAAVGNVTITQVERIREQVFAPG